MAGIENLKITIVYNNYPYKEGLETAWGFSCLVEGAQKTILFDTGGDAAILLGNMEKLRIDPTIVDVVVLSHIHTDHTGGLEGFLEKNSKVTVYLLEAFGDRFNEEVRSRTAQVVEVEKPAEICTGVYSTGRLGRVIKEQSLAVKTDRGLVMVTGCAHPGIVRILKSVKQQHDDQILLAMGGFHLEWATNSKISRVVSEMKELGVKCVAPSHCSGDRARELFEKHFGHCYITTGAGSVIEIRDVAGM